MLLYDKKIILSILFSSPEFNLHIVLCLTLSARFHCTDQSPRFDDFLLVLWS